MRILLLCEGDAETTDSWSGVSQSIVKHLRAAGHTVETGDVDLYGFARAAVAATAFATARRRWWVKYHLGAAGFRTRSFMAARRVREKGRNADIILQIGATFRVPNDVKTPVVMFCDSNIEHARRGAGTGFSDAAFLSDREIGRIRAREASVYARARLIFTMSHAARASFIEDFAIAPDRLVTLHCGPNTDLADVLEGAARKWPPTVLFVGKDFGRKGGDVLLRAFHRVREQVPDARLVMIGGRSAVPQPEYVEFWGFQSRGTPEGRTAMDRAYRNASVFCLPTRFEAFGTSFVEAMFYELPCVGPAAWAVPEIIVHGETGFTVTPEDADAYADALIELLADPERARRMGRAGRRRALELFTWPGIVERMVQSVTPLLRRVRNEVVEPQSAA